MQSDCLDCWRLEGIWVTFKVNSNRIPSAFLKIYGSIPRLLLLHRPHPYPLLTTRLAADSDWRGEGVPGSGGLFTGLQLWTGLGRFGNEPKRSRCRSTRFPALPSHSLKPSPAPLSPPAVSRPPLPGLSSAAES